MSAEEYIGAMASNVSKAMKNRLKKAMKSQLKKVKKNRLKKVKKVRMSQLKNRSRMNQLMKKVKNRCQGQNPGQVMKSRHQCPDQVSQVKKVAHLNSNWQKTQCLHLKKTNKLIMEHIR